MNGKRAERHRGHLGVIGDVAGALREDLRIVSRRLGHDGSIAHPSVLLDMSSLALATLRTSIALRRLTGRSFGTRSLLKWAFRMDVWTDDIGPGLTLPHPFNIVIGSGVSVGRGCTLMHNTTLQRAKRTRLDQGVMLGAGAVVLADCTIGAGATCGANSVVTRDVAPGAVVAGAPAKPLRGAHVEAM